MQVFLCIYFLSSFYACTMKYSHTYPPMSLFQYLPDPLITLCPPFYFKPTESNQCCPRVCNPPVGQEQPTCDHTPQRKAPLPPSAASVPIVPQLGVEPHEPSPIHLCWYLNTESLEPVGVGGVRNNALSGS